MEALAADNSHGYSQANRWGPDYDCSSAVITAWERAGVPVKTKGATYTGNMRAVFLLCGFKDVTKSVNLKTGDGLKRGDVLLNDTAHTAMVTGLRRVVHARSSEGNSIPGDQSGNEIRVQDYWNYPWDCVLRYPETISYDGDAGEADADPVPETGSGDLEADGVCGSHTWELIAEQIRMFPQVECKRDAAGRITDMSTGWHVTALQALLNYMIPEADLDADGEYGPLTEAAVRDFQRKN